MKSIYSIALCLLLVSQFTYARSGNGANNCKTDEDCIKGYQKCSGGKCVWLKSEDQDIYNLGLIDAAANCVENVNQPGVKDCQVCFFPIDKPGICKDDGQPIGIRGCVHSIYE